MICTTPLWSSEFTTNKTDRAGRYIANLRKQSQQRQDKERTPYRTPLALYPGVLSSSCICALSARLKNELFYKKKE